MKSHYSIIYSLLLVVIYGCGTEAFGLDIDYEKNLSAVNENLARKGKYPIIAHRGAWSETGHPQNSLAALKEALSLDIFGSECDIWKTSDNVFVICHDQTYNGMDVTKCTYAELAQYPLNNGERIPTLDDFLTALEASTTQTKLVIELKSNAQPMEVFEAVNKRGLLHKVVFITYSYKKCQTFASMGCGDIAYYIGGSKTPEEIRYNGIGGIINSEENIRKVPDWIERSSNVGVQLVLGSVNNPSIMNQYIDRGCLFSSNRPITLVKAIDKQVKVRKATKKRR